MPPRKRFIICEICGNRAGNTEKRKKFMANFPLDAFRCKQWIKVVGKEDLIHFPIEKLHSLKYVCGNHFSRKDFNKKRNCLNKSAVPSKNLKAKPLSDEMLLDFPHNFRQKLCNSEVSIPQVETIAEPCLSDEEICEINIKREADVTLTHTFESPKLCSEYDEELLFDTFLDSKSSSNEEINHFKPCRICAQEEGNIPIFNNECNPHIPEDIKNFSGVIITPSDGMSQFMCKDCLELLNECIIFRDMCRLTNKSLLDSSVKNNKNCSVDGDDIQNLEAVSRNDMKQEPEIWKCSFCNKLFLNLTSYETHIKSCYKTTERNATETREDVQVKRKREYSNYREGKIKLSKLTSDSPGFSVSHHQEVNLSESDKDKPLGLYGGRMLKCPHCDHTAPTAVDLLGHVRQVHSRSPKNCNCNTNMENNGEGIGPNGIKHECDVCFKYFKTIYGLRRHKETVHQIERQKFKVKLKKMSIKTTIEELECEHE